MNINKLYHHNVPFLIFRKMPFRLLREKNLLHGSVSSLNDKIQTQKASDNVSAAAGKISKNLRKNTTSKVDFSKLSKNKNKSLNDPALLTSNVMPPILEPSHKLDSYRDDSLASQLSTEKIQF